MPLTKIDDRGLKTPIDLLDNEKIRLGTGNDLEIYHNGSQNYINTSNGSIELRHTVGGADEPMIKAYPNGQVQLMYNGATKLDTTSTGISVTGEIVASGGVNFGGGKASINVNSNVMDFVDNFALRLGNSQDLAIYHNGNHSKIRDEGTGNLYIESDNGNIYLRVNDNEQAVTAVQNGAVELYHDNAKKLETSSIGVNIFGDSTVGVNNNTQANLHFTSPSDNASARYSRIRKNYNSPFNMEYFASTSSSAQNHVFYSNLTTEVARIQGAGGISFNGDTAAANALDDYEEGSWTPVVEGTTTTGTVTYGARVGKYVKIGKVVTWEFYLNFSSGNGAGTMHITGLPFTVSNNGTYPAVNIGYVQNISLRSGHTLYGLHATGSNYLYFYEMPDGGGANVQPVYDGNGSLIMSGHYQVG